MRFRNYLKRVWAEVWSQGVERSAASALAVFRLVSWALTAGFYLAAKTPQGALAFKLAVVGFLLLAAVIAILLLDRAAADPKQVARLALVEALVLPVVLLPTGGFGSPFVWYALNPLLAAAVYLPTSYTWGVVGTFLVAAFVATELSPVTSGESVMQYAQIVLILALVTLITRVQARLVRTLEAQSKRIAEQSEALRQAYAALEARGEALSLLAEFQRQAVSCAGAADLYALLSATVTERLGASWAGVLYAVSELGEGLMPCPWMPDVPGCRLSASGAPMLGQGQQGLDWAAIWPAVQQQVGASEAASLVEIEGGFVAVPALIQEGRVVAVFVAAGADPRRTEMKVLLEYVRQLAGRFTTEERIGRTLDYLGNVHQVVEGAGVSRDEAGLIELVTLYAKQLTGAEKAAYWPADLDDADVLKAMPSIIRGRREGLLAEDFSTRVAAWWSSATPGAPSSLDYYEQNGTIWHACYTVVRSSDRRYGVLFVLSDKPFGLEIDVARTMTFLGYLTGAMLERQRAEELHGRLLVAEEQGRIAAEIHDGVSQSLFSLVYGLQGAIGTLEEGKQDEARATLGTLRDVAASVSRDIRSSIYRLAPMESRDTFVRAVGTHLQDLGELYDVKTRLEVQGSEDNLSPALRRAIYRIIREAASNAVRHGKGSEVSIRLSLGPAQTIIEVTDDGCGFVSPPAPHLLKKAAGTGRGGGLGLLNMSQLARSFDGSLSIASAPGTGTRLTVKIPDHEGQAREGGANETAAGR